MRTKHYFTLLLLCLSFGALAQDFDNICYPVGWCEYDGNVTGGEGGDTVWVNTFEDLKTHAESEDTEVIILTGSVGTGGGITSRIYLNSNKTLLGYGNAELHGSIFIAADTNVVIRNLKVRGDGAHDRDGEDCIALSYAERVWLDHLDVVDGGDGNLDIVRESNYVTVSWCRFSYTDASTYHQWSNLNGNSDDRITDRGKLKITFHHNYWAPGCIRRMPNVRFGQVHVVNNYYRTEQNDDFCIGATKEADMLIENNSFEWVNEALMYTNTATAAQMRNNLFIATLGGKTGFGTAFTPPYPYTMTAVEDVENVVRFNVGRRDLNDLLCNTQVSADCNGTPNGTAYEDICGVCVEGTTGLLPCTGSVEAELACSVDGVLLESTNSGFSGDGYVNTDNILGATASWILDYTGSSDATLTFRFANGGTGARDADILVNNVNVVSLSLPTTGAWTTWELASVSIPLSPGSNEVKLVANTNDGIANLDRISHSTGVSDAGCVINSTTEARLIADQRVYPNPVHSTLHILASDENQTYQILNTTGELVLEGNGNAVDVSSLASGLYFLITEGENRVKFVKR